MSNKPIFVATHPRACSTAFERVFMTQRQSLKCFHEPFGDAFYYGPERLSSRFENDEKARVDSGFQNSTYDTIIDRFEKEGAEGKRLFIKDMIYYLQPPNDGIPSIAPSLQKKKRGVGTVKAQVNGVGKGHQDDSCAHNSEAEPGNPTIIPEEILSRFHFTFLIRHPRSSIPSYYRCTVPPLDEVTGFYEYMPSEAGYVELRRVFDYLRNVGQIGPEVATRKSTNGHMATTDEARSSGQVEICVVDADDLLDDPEGIIKAFCKSTSINYDDKMLNWESEEDQQQAKEAFEKWTGFHDDAMNSRDLKPRLHVSRLTQNSLLEVANQYAKKKKQPKSKESEDNEWREKFGVEGAKVIRETVDANVEDYEYLKQYALRIEE